MSALTVERISAAALALVDEGGPEALALSEVARRLDVKPPSLYKHIDGLDELRKLVQLAVTEEMTQRFAAASIGRSGAEAIGAVMHAYREFAAQHPHRYAIAPADPLGDPALAAAGKRMLGVVAACLRQYRLSDADTVHALRVLRTVAHGFATVESAGGFGLPEDCDVTYERLIAMVIRDIETGAPSPPEGS